jgi:hypothetical protein
MTDLLEAPGPLAEQGPTFEAPPTPRSDPEEQAQDAGQDRAMPVDWLLGALLLGAGAIHLALAPAHLAEKTALGWGFLLSAWAQIGLAVLVVAKPRTWTRALAAVTSAALFGAWVASRTVGLPFGLIEEAESVEVVDAACAALEVLAVILAVRLLLQPRTEERRWSVFATVVATLAIVGATAAIASPASTSHEHGADAAEDDLGFSALQNGQMAGDHSHAGAASAAEQAAVVRMGPETRKQLATQLAATAGLVEKYPTLADAEKAGYWRAGPFSPGLGVHYNPPTPGVDTDGAMDEADLDKPQLIYAGLEQDAPLAGFMYLSFRDEAPQGFAGPLDSWHFHTDVCMVNTPKGLDTPFGADAEGITEEMCAAKGGTLMDFTGYMVHVWTVPGYESPLGTFSDLNPKLTCPDGTYHRIPVTKIGSKATTCLDA